MAQDEEPNMNGHANGSLANGRPLNGHAKGAAHDEMEDDDQTDENIFLFVPNLIGMRRTHPPI